MKMLEPADPWRRPSRPGAGGKAAGLAITTADRPADHIPLPALPVAAGWARRRGIEVLHARGLDPDTVDVVSLLISELVTNALLHGLSAAAAGGSAARCAECGGQLCLNLREEPGAVVIEVFDAALLPPQRTEGALTEHVLNENAFADATFDDAVFNEEAVFNGTAFSDTARGDTLDDAAFDDPVFDNPVFDNPVFDGAERGRGLLLVANLSEEQGYYLPQAGGKVVWCVVKAEV